MEAVEVLVFFMVVFLDCEVFLPEIGCSLSALLPVVFETVLSELLSVSAVFSSDCSSLSAVCSLLSGVSTELIETLLSA